MPIQSPPLTFSCRACGWKRTTPGPVSDFRIAGFTHFSHCPQCGGEVETQRASSAGSFIAKLAAWYRGGS